MNSAFSVSKQDDGDGVARLAVRGEIDRDVSAALATIIANAAAQPGVTALVVDLLRVPFLAAAGLRALLEGRAAAVAHGLPYRVVNANGVTRTVLQTAGLVELFGVHHPARVPERLTPF